MLMSRSVHPLGQSDVVEHSAYWDNTLVLTLSNYHLNMAGAIIENMSTKKLVFLGFFILVLQVLSILVGAFIGKSDFIAC